MLEQEIREELGTAANQYIGTIKGKDRVHSSLNENETPQPAANINEERGGSHARGPRDRESHHMGEYALDGFDDDDDDDDEGHNDSTSGALPLLALALGDGIDDAAIDGGAHVRAVSRGARASDNPVRGNRARGGEPVPRQDLRQQRTHIS